MSWLIADALFYKPTCCMQKRSDVLYTRQQVRTWADGGCSRIVRMRKEKEVTKGNAV